MATALGLLTKERFESATASLPDVMFFFHTLIVLHSYNSLANLRTIFFWAGWIVTKVDFLLSSPQFSEP